MKGFLIAIEGTDGSGKATQSALLYDRLKEAGTSVKKIEFPNYKSESSSLAKMYLAGDFGKNPEDVSPKVASTFYAADRFASYRMEWESFYKEGGVIIADRYTTSNMVHQASKIKNEEEKNSFLDWLWDLEYNIYGIPVPDAVIFLDMPPEYSIMLMKERANKFTGNLEKDIHEKSSEYIQASYSNALGVAKKYGWHIVHCIRDGKIKDKEEIMDEVLNITSNYIKLNR